jgi:hypothetical protein
MDDGAGARPPAGRTTRISLLLRDGDRPSLVRWCTWDPPWQAEGENTSYALLTAAGPVLIDPEAPAPEEDGRLWGLLGRPPVATVLTTGDHERDAYRLRERFGAPVWAPAAALPARGGGLEGRPDAGYEAGAALPGGLAPTVLSGAPPDSGAHALRWVAPDGTRVVFSGDVLTGGAEPSHPDLARLRHRRPGLYLGSGPAYLARCDLDRLRADLERLRSGLDAGPDAGGTAPGTWIAGGHGLPHGPEAGPTLARLLELDWTAGWTVAASTPRDPSRSLDRAPGAGVRWNDE